MRQKKDISKTALVYEKLKQMIIAGEFSVTSNWSLRKLAKKFNLSIAPAA